MSSNLSPAFRCTTIALTIVIALAGCGFLGQSGRDDLADELSFSFEGSAGPGYMDQILAIVNEAEHSVVINAEIEAVDAAGDVIPDVKVHSIYGSMIANMVIGPGENIDVLIFDGPEAAAVDDVRITQVEAIPVEASAWPTPVDAVPLDDDEVPLDYPAGFTKIALQNSNGESTDVRVVAIIWNNPDTDQRQQALEVIELSQLVTVPHGNTIVIDVEKSARDLIDKYGSTHAVSLKAYYSQ